MIPGSGSGFHICYVEAGYPHPHGGGGAGTFVQLAGRELVRRGHQVSVIAASCPQCGEFQEDQGVHIYRPQFDIPLHWYLSRLPGICQLAQAVRTLEVGRQNARFIDQLHKKQPIQIIEFSDGGDVWHTLHHTIPCVVHLHGSRYTFLRKSGRPVQWGDRLERQLGLWCIRKADQVISPSQAILDEVQGEAGETFPGAVVLPYPLDPRVLAPVGNTSSTSRKSVRILFAARNDPVKGGDVLLQAVPIVHRQFPEVEFHFYGYQPELEAEKISRVTFHPFLPKEQLIDEYSEADICIVPSFWDNSPNTVYEAMGAGKPVIASRVGGIPELVKDHETGLLVEPDNYEQLAEAINELLKKPQTRITMGNTARHYIQEIATMTRNLDRRVNIYFEVTARLKKRVQKGRSPHVEKTCKKYTKEKKY
jgi:glycosyltransferase involved in cell wall biosynthesis